MVERIGEGRKGAAYQYLLAENAVLPFSPIYAEQQNSRTESETGAAPSPENAVLPFSHIYGEQQNSRTESEGPLCRACGRPLSEAEARVSLQLHWDCTLPARARSRYERRACVQALSAVPGGQDGGGFLVEASQGDRASGLVQGMLSSLAVGVSRDRAGAGPAT